MSHLRTLIVFCCTLALAATCLAKPLDDYLTEANKAQQAGDLQQAVTVLEAAAKEYPDNPNVFAYLGLYKGMQAGATQNIMEAGQLANESFTLLDKAVGLDSLNVNARFNRGLMGIKVPAFMGRLDGAIRDLEFVTVMNHDVPDMVSTSMLSRAYDLLGEGYQKKGDNDKAKAAWQQVIELAPGSSAAKAAEAKIAGLSAGAAPTSSASSATPSATSGKPAGATAQPPSKPAEAAGGSKDVAILMDKAKAAMDSHDYATATALLKQVVSLDSTNARAFRMLGSALAYSDSVYDERIAKDTTLRTNLAFEAMADLDKAVGFAPDDLEARLIRGIMGVNFPFFVNKLDQGIADLDMVANSSAPEPMKAQAAYWLGFGYQKKGMSFWTKIVTDNSDPGAVRMALAGMRPQIQHFDRSKYTGPVVAIDFLLGFRDKLQPQTAVWIENAQGVFLRTVYISGFSGHAKGVQVVLPVYAKASNFGDADAVTGASIDAGHHLSVWDLKDAAGKAVPPGKYTVKVETSYWPSMKYQLQSAEIEVGKTEDHKVVQQGDFIPYLEVKYLP